MATAVPPHILYQEDVAERARAIFGGRYGDLERLMPVFKSAGIDKRHTVMPVEWYHEPRAWPDRTAAYLDGAQELFVEAATAALAAAGCTPADVDAIVTISSTGIATPSLEARVAGRMGFRADVERVPVFGLGCAGGATGQNAAYASFIPRKSVPSTRNTVHFTAFSIVVPAISSVRLRFSSVLLVCPWMVVSALAPREGSAPEA